MTLEAWVRPTDLGTDWRTALIEGAAGRARLRRSTRTAATPGRRCRPARSSAAASGMRRRATPLALNTWTHLATTYDGTTLRLFVNGVQAGAAGRQRLRSPPRPARSGSAATAIWGEWFQGDIDEVRIYNRALTATEIQADMNTSISAPDAIAAERTRDADRHRRPRPGRAQLGRGDRQRRRRALQRPPRHDAPGSRRRRATGSRSRPGRATPTPASPPAPTTTGSPPRTSPATSGPPGNEASAVSAADTTPPTVVDHRAGAGRHGLSDGVAVNASASDNGTVAGVQFKARRRQPRRRGHDAPRTRIAWDTFAAGERPAHADRGRTRRAPATRRPPRTSPVTVQNTALAGLVGAWAFDEGSGTTTADQSGQRQHRHARERDLGRRPASSTTRSRSTARTPGSPCPTPPRST